jgi:hypothetical protein
LNKNSVNNFYNIYNHICFILQYYKAYITMAGNNRVDKVVFGTGGADEPASGRLPKPKTYKKYGNSDVIREALAFYILPPGTTLAAYSKVHSNKVPLSTMRRLFFHCKVFEMKTNNTSVGEVEKVLTDYLKKKRMNERTRTGAAHVALRYLTDNEELAIVQIARLMGSCGAGVGRDEVLDMVNTYIHHHADARMIQPATMNLVEQLLKRHSELAKLVSASSLDPQRAKQATRETRDAVFFKLDCYVKTLHAMGLCEWESYKDVPDEDKLNMDEVGADTTKHRKKVIADKVADWARVFQVTPEGDGKMNIHVTLCITTCGNGRFADVKNRIEGACAPVIIHCDKTKTKEKEEEERRKQRAGEKPSERFVAERYSAGIDIPEIDVLTTRNGSMTQETFEEYANHLVKSLPENHGPKILFLDGHGSRWNRQTLLFLIKNKIFPFIFASHTSIWAQPNDGGTNLRLHNCIEEAVRAKRRSGDTPDVTYFNIIVCDAYRIFLERERGDLRAKTTNTTQNSYLKSGVNSFNPHCDGWTTAIETTGRVLNNKERQAKQFEPVARKNARELTLDEKKQLREGIDYMDVDSDLGDIPFAILRAQEILGKWRDEVRKAVEEGEEGVDIAEARDPLPWTQAQRLALEIVELAVVDVDAIELPAEKTKEQRAIEITNDIVRTSYLADCIKVTYLSSDSEESEESESESDTVTELRPLSGRAIKTHLADDPDDNSWNVTVRDAGGNGKTFEVKEKELLGKTFIIERSYNDLCAEQKKKVLAKNKRMRRKEARAEETKLANIARERRRELEREEYKNIIDIFASGRTYEWEEFKDLLDRMRKPFSCSVDGRDVTVTEADAAIMMEKSALDEISKILVSNKRTANDGTNKPPAKRRKNNAACNTTRGATGFDALHGAARRDHRDNEANLAKLVKGHQREKEAIKKLLTLVDKRKVACSEAAVKAMEAARVARRRRAALVTNGMTGGSTLVTEVSRQGGNVTNGRNPEEEQGPEAGNTARNLVTDASGLGLVTEGRRNELDVTNGNRGRNVVTDGTRRELVTDTSGRTVDRAEERSEGELVTNGSGRSRGGATIVNERRVETPPGGVTDDARRDLVTERTGGTANGAEEPTDGALVANGGGGSNGGATNVSGRGEERPQGLSSASLRAEDAQEADDRFCESMLCVGYTIEAAARLCEVNTIETNLSVAEYWQVHRTSLTGTMDLFLRIFLPKCGVLQKNKSVKWRTLEEKVIAVGLLTRTQFDSRVEDLTRKLRIIEKELAELATAPSASDDNEITT